MRPGLFLRELLCLDDLGLPDDSGPGCQDFTANNRLPVTGFAHHPYSITSAPETPDPHPEHHTLADLPRLYELLDRGASAARIPPALPVWSTD